MKQLLLTALLLGCGLPSAEPITPIEPILVGNVYFTPRVINTFFHIYDSQPREIPLCLEGLNFEGQYIVNKVKIPIIVDSDSHSSSYDSESCYGPNYLGIAHNHPKGLCQPSQTDLERFWGDEKSRIETIICGVSLEDDELRLFALNKDADR